MYLQYVCQVLLEMYDVGCDRSNILDLDSSTEAKFSRHLVFHLPCAAFRDNIHAGEFSLRVTSYLTVMPILHSSNY